MRIETVISKDRKRGYHWRVMFFCECLGEGFAPTKREAEERGHAAARDVSFTRGTVVMASSIPFQRFSHYRR